MPVLRSKACLLAFLLLGAVQAGAQSEPFVPRPDAVAGQIDLSHVEANFVDGRGFSGVRDVAIDTSVVPNRVYVFDFLNNRVLGWRSTAALTNGAPADLVLGQPDFFTVSCGRSREKLCFSDPIWAGSLAVDANGNVYVADTGNFRILEFDSPFTTDTLADRVFGASDFTAFGCELRPGDQFPPNTPCPAMGLALDRAGNLYVADGIDSVDGATGIYVYRQPLTTDTVADVHFGDTRCDLPQIDASSFCNPQGLAVDAADNLYVADLALERVLVFRSPLTTDGVADLVIGQPDFTTRGFGCHPSDPAPIPADRLCAPTSVEADAAGNLWVADSSHNRVLGYDSPLATDTVPDRVLGKRGSLTSGENSCSFTNEPPIRDLFCVPRGLALDSQGALWVGDSAHHRVVRISTPLAAGARPDLVLGQVDFVHNTVNLVDGRGFSGPMTAAVDRASSPNHIYVLDSMNHRVLGWRDADDLAAGRPADLVFGQPDLFSNRCNNGEARPSARSLCFATFLATGGLAVDGAGNLYVADTANNRVLEFDSPFTTDTVADRVFGQQGSFTTRQRNKGGVSAGSLSFPVGLAVDRQGSLYVADLNNYRVLRYDQPLRRDDKADRVYGKRGRFDLGVRPASSVCVGGRDSLCRPQSVAVDGAGNLYVSDTGNHRVLQYDRGDDLPERVFGQRGSFRDHTCGNGQDRLCDPAGIAVSPSGELYIAARRYQIVVRYSPPFREPRIDLVMRGFLAPSGVAVDPSGNVYVTDELNRVLVYDNP